MLVTGGAGYVGSVLVPHLLNQGHHVRVLDLYIFGELALKDVRSHVNLLEIKGDIKNPDTVKAALKGCTAVIHLAGEPDEDPIRINSKNSGLVYLDAFASFVRIAKENGVKRFIYASSACAYGNNTETTIIESDPLEKTSELGRHIAECEATLRKERTTGFATIIVRTGNVFGLAPMCRLDIPANAFTYAAIKEKIIKVCKSAQNYPSIHIKDLVGLYAFLLAQPDARVDGETYNAVTENHSLLELAETIRDIVDSEIRLEEIPPQGSASCKVSSHKMRDELGFVPRQTLKEAIRDMTAAFRTGDFIIDINHRLTNMDQSP